MEAIFSVRFDKTIIFYQLLVLFDFHIEFVKFCCSNSHNMGKYIQKNVPKNRKVNICALVINLKTISIGINFQFGCLPLHAAFECDFRITFQTERKVRVSPCPCRLLC